MNNPSIFHHSILKIKGDQQQPLTDQLAVEEPLEIQLLFGPANDRKRQSVAVTMRTPGQDFDLAVGFLFTEGIIQNNSQIKKVAYAHTIDPSFPENTVVVVLSPEVEVNLKQLERHFYTSSSCGVCGKASIEAVMVNNLPDLPLPVPFVDIKSLHTLPEKLRAVQAVFDQTGGLHAAALFTQAGELTVWREDVGRHNALDKLIGHHLRAGALPCAQSILLVSGRASFELVQKALVAGIPFMAAVGAPSSLAVQMAERYGMTLIGFLRRGQYNLYCGAGRVWGIER